MPTRILPTVLIVGGGFAGRAALCHLKSQSTPVNIVLVDDKPFFEYTPGVLRCVVEPRHVAEIISSHQVHGITFLHAQLAQLQAEEAMFRCVDSNNNFVTTVPFDYCIIATGLSFSRPIHSEIPGGVSSQAQRRGEFMQCREAIQTASHILIIGGGTVGVELASELTKLTQDADKEVILASSNELLPRLPSRAGRYAKRWLEKRGVQVIRAMLQQTGLREDGPTEFADERAGIKVSPDLVFDCTGAKANTTGDVLVSGGLIQRSQVYSNGSISVLNTLQLPGVSHIFVAGDVARVQGELGLGQLAGEKTAYAAEEAGLLAAVNVERLIVGQVHNRRARGLNIYPRDAFPFGIFPRLFVVSLYKYDAILCAGPLVVTGFLPAIIKYIIEYCSMQAAYGDAVTRWIFKFLERFIFWMVVLLTIATKFLHRRPRRLGEVDVEET